jgi:hypothetical protein
MASKGKQKTTMAKRNREDRVRQHKLEKAARKDARKLAPPEDPIGADHMVNGAYAQLGGNLDVVDIDAASERA